MKGVALLFTAGSIRESAVLLLYHQWNCEKLNLMKGVAPLFTAGGIRESAVLLL